MTVVLLYAVTLVAFLVIVFFENVLRRVTWNNCSNKQARCYSESSSLLVVRVAEQTVLQ